MAQEQSVQVLDGNASQRNDADHITRSVRAVFPVLLSEESGGDQLGSVNMHHSNSLPADHVAAADDQHTNRPNVETSAAERQQQTERRKRGRPRKTNAINTSEQGQSGDGGQAIGDEANDQPPLKRSRNIKKEDVVHGSKRATNSTQAGEPSMPVKRGRGRPRKNTTPRREGGERQATTSMGVGNVGVTTAHTSTAIYSAVQQQAAANSSVVVSAIHGTPVQVLPTAVAAMNTIESGSLRAAPVSVLVSPSRDDTSTEWMTRRMSPLSPPLMTTTTDEVKLVEIKAHGPSLVQGTTSPPLLHAEQPKVLNLLPQCIVTNSVVRVNLVDRFASREDSGDGHVVSSKERKDHKQTRGEKKQERGKEGEISSPGETVTKNSSSKKVEDVPVKKRKAQQTSKKPEEPPQEESTVKRKRGRPPKTQTQAQTTVEPAAKERSRKKAPTSTEDVKPEPSTEDPTTTQDTETVVKRKRGRPPKNRDENPPAESHSLSLRRQDKPLVVESSTNATTNGEDKSLDSGSSSTHGKTSKKGRPPKASKVKVQTNEATGQPVIKRRRGRPRKYPVPVVTVSGPFLPSMSGVTLPVTGGNGNADEEANSDGGGTATPPHTGKSKQHEANGQSVVATTTKTPVKRKRGRPPKTPEDEQGPAMKRRRGRPRKESQPVKEDSASPQPMEKHMKERDEEEEEEEEEKELPQPPRKRLGRPRKAASKKSPEIKQKKPAAASPVAENQTAGTVVPSKRKRGRPRKIAPVVATLQEPPLVLSTLADDSSIPLGTASQEQSEDNSVETEKMTLQISFSDSDSEHSENLEEQTSAIMALANRVVPPTPPPPPPPRQRDSPLLDPSFEESYDEDSDPETK